MVTWLAQSNRGKEDFCLFCVYGSFGHSGMICSISFSSSKHQQDIPEIPETAHNFRKVSLVSLFFIIIFDFKKRRSIYSVVHKLLQYFCCPQGSIDDFHVDGTEREHTSLLFVHFGFTLSNNGTRRHCHYVTKYIQYETTIKRLLL